MAKWFIQVYPVSWVTLNQAKSVTLILEYITRVKIQTFTTTTTLPLHFRTLGAGKKPSCTIFLATFYCISPE